MMRVARRASVAAVANHPGSDRVGLGFGAGGLSVPPARAATPSSEQNPMPVRFRHNSPRSCPVSVTTASRRIPFSAIRRWMLSRSAEAATVRPRKVPTALAGSVRSAPRSSRATTLSKREPSVTSAQWTCSSSKRPCRSATTAPRSHTFGAVSIASATVLVSITIPPCGANTAPVVHRPPDPGVRSRSMSGWSTFMRIRAGFGSLSR